MASATPATVRKTLTDWRPPQKRKMSHYHDDQTKILSPETISGKTCTHTFSSNCRPCGDHLGTVGIWSPLLFADTLTKFQSERRELDYVSFSQLIWNCSVGSKVLLFGMQIVPYQKVQQNGGGGVRPRFSHDVFNRVVQLGLVGVGYSYQQSILICLLN